MTSFQAGECVMIRDDFLSAADHIHVSEFLNGPGWQFGAYSDPSPQTSRYWFKHFAGYAIAEGEAPTHHTPEIELHVRSALLGRVWDKIKAEAFIGRELARCYANGYPYGSEGALHVDADRPGDLTALYYPARFWSPNFGGETVFFNAAGDDVVACVYPRPNRLVIFPGTMPHVARGVSRLCPVTRVTLMFKTKDVRR